MSPQIAQPSGRYALHGVIGAGGFATVHVGRRLGAFGFSKTVAIKRLHPQFARDKDCVSMLVDEANVSSQVHHANVLSCLDLVQTEHELFLVFDYVHGASLALLRRTGTIRNQPMPVPIAVAIMNGMLRGLHAAHEATDASGNSLGIIHRDISPANVLVGTDGVARVLDFGVARALGRQVQTVDGAVKGKFGYMAPEQVRGEAIDRRADLFAAGVVLWEILAGEYLFQGDTEAQVIHQTLRCVVPDLATRRADVPAALSRLLTKALSADPAQRFRTALEMAESLEACAPAASHDAVGAWVRSVAEEELEKLEATLRTLDQQQPQIEIPAPIKSRVTQPARSSRKWVAAVAVVGLLAALSAGLMLRALTSSPPPSVLDAAAPQPPAAKPEPHDAPVDSALSAAPPSPQTEPASRVKRRDKARKRTSCDPPYTVDSNGHKHFRPECL